MRWQATPVETLSDEQVEDQIREWNESAEKMENMTPAEARRYVGSRQPNTTNIIRMTENMMYNIRKKAPSKDAEKKMLKAWERRTRAYYRIMALIGSSVPSSMRKSTTTTADQLLDSATGDEDEDELSSSKPLEASSDPAIVVPIVAAVMLIIIFTIVAKRKKIVCFKPKPMPGAEKDADKGKTSDKTRLIEKDKNEQGGGRATHLRDISFKTDNKAASMSPQLQPLIADGREVYTDVL